MKKAVLFINGFAILAILGLWLYMAWPQNYQEIAGALFGIIIFGGWDISPHGYLLYTNLINKSGSRHIVIDLVASITITLYGLTFYFGNWPKIDQSGLTYMLIPLHLWMGIGIIFGIGTWIYNPDKKQYEKSKHNGE